jgi:hypothetical protein
MTIMDTPGLLDMETEMGTIVLAAEHEQKLSTRREAVALPQSVFKFKNYEPKFVEM